MSPAKQRKHYDYIIIGSGIAGLYTALLAREHGSVLVITKGRIDDCNTKYAQGGIAAAIGDDDSPDLHFEDTVSAGVGLSDAEAVRILANEAPDRISEMVNLGVPFDTLNGTIALAREAAHSAPRILHAGGDATGAHIEVTLGNRIRESHIQVREDAMAIEIVVNKGTVTGIKVLDCLSGTISEYECRYLILATGGAGQLYRFNTNSEVATGDGLALAFNAGAQVSDMEFYQFHPTALRLPGVEPFLVSEAVRGEGGILRNTTGHRFMPDYTPKADLAPRDIVARSILYEMEKTGSDKVFIDVTHLPARIVTTRFPNIYRFCLEHHLDITRDLIPVAPAAHYMIGGIKTNVWGETSIAGLFACGETACVAIHGANRLASNSLLEAVVFSKRIVERTWHDTSSMRPNFTDDSCQYHTLPERSRLTVRPTPDISKLQSVMWDRVGIIREKEGLTEAAETLYSWQGMLPARISRASLEISSLMLSGRLVVEAALLREESRGAHFRTDFPGSMPEFKHHIIFTNS